MTLTHDIEANVVDAIVDELVLYFSNIFNVDSSNIDVTIVGSTLQLNAIVSITNVNENDVNSSEFENDQYVSDFTDDLLVIIDDTIAIYDDAMATAIENFEVEIITKQPSANPTNSPSDRPTLIPTMRPTPRPTDEPTTALPTTQSPTRAPGQTLLS